MFNWFTLDLLPIRSLQLKPHKTLVSLSNINYQASKTKFQTYFVNPMRDLTLDFRPSPIILLFP